MIRRHHTADSVNVVINHPSVYEWVKGLAIGKLDLTPAVQNSDNVLLMGEYGGVFFTMMQPGIYEAHTQVLPAGRGEWTLNMVNEALRWMFSHTDALDIVTRVPKGNLAARALTKSIHGMLEYTIKLGWMLRGTVIPADVYSLSIQRWMSTAPGLEEKGQWFHHRLEEEYLKMGTTLPTHAEDPVHDRYVGAAVEMVMNGQVNKGVVFYNRWALISGYAPMEVVTENPLVIDIRDALLMVRDNDFWVIRCL